MSDGTVECWGQNEFGQLGRPDGVQCSGPSCASLTNAAPGTPDAAAAVDQPAAPVTGLDGVTAISAGGFHTCALRSDKTVRCWGHGLYGQLGNGTTNTSYVPASVSTLSNVAGVSASYDGTCMWLGDGSVWCSGDDEFTQLGAPVATTCAVGGAALPCAKTPVAVPDIARATGVAAGFGFSSAILADGTVTWWGGMALLNGDDGGAPEALSGIQGATAMAEGLGGHECVILKDRTAACWGENAAGELGRRLAGGNMWGFAATAAPVPGLGEVKAIASGGDHFTCALLTGGTVDCWGYDLDGELGRANLVPQVVEQGPPLTHVVGIAAGEYQACAVLGDGTVQCWGNGNATPRVVPL